MPSDDIVEEPQRNKELDKSPNSALRVQEAILKELASQEVHKVNCYDQDVEAMDTESKDMAGHTAQTLAFADSMNDIKDEQPPGWTTANDMKFEYLLYGHREQLACQVCGKNFIDENRLRKHEKLHSVDRPFICEICTKAFTTQAHLKEHLKIHTGFKPYRCDVCGKSFIRAPDLKKHERVHSNERPFGCQMCEKAFKHKSHLKDHERRHRGEKPFICGSCTKAFAKASDLKRHENNMHSERKQLSASSLQSETEQLQAAAMAAEAEQLQSIACKEQNVNVIPFVQAEEMENESCEVGRDSGVIGSKPSRKRISDHKTDRSPSDRKKIKDATGKTHKSRQTSWEKGEKQSGSATMVIGTHSCSESYCKPLQEPKITSSEKLTCHVKEEWDVYIESSDPNMGTDPSTCRKKSYTDINNNKSVVREELHGQSAIDSAAHQNITSQRPAHTKKTKHTESSGMKDKNKHKSKHRKEGTHRVGKENNGEPMEQTEVTQLTMNRSKSESKTEKDKSNDGKKKKQTKSKDAIGMVKDEQKMQVEVKTLKKGQENDWESNTGETNKEKEKNPVRKKENDKGRSRKRGSAGIEDEKTVKGGEEGKSSHKKKRIKGRADADEPKRTKEMESKIQKSKGKDVKEEAKPWKWNLASISPTKNAARKQRRWEEGQSVDGQKWKTLEHKGPLFPPDYEPLPQTVSFYYSGKPVRLSVAAEEVATFFAKMLDHEYTSKDTFQNNFFTDWKKEMTKEERGLIQNLSKCDFQEIHKYFVEKAEEKKALTKEEKQVLKEETSRQMEVYGFCLLDGHREKIGNFRVEPPGLFRGRGEHPKMGKLKTRVLPEDITINCSEDSSIPVAPKGHRWKKVQHDNTVTWLASWVENVQGNFKYVMLNPSSKLKGEKDWQKYEIARKLKLKVDTIRRQYHTDWKSREMKKRQRGVAVYFIDKLALRAGNEKEEGETADTVGCCSLRVEHITLHEKLDDQEFVVEFDFLGKDSIRYYNKVPVEKRVFKNLKLFMENKSPDDELFDRIQTAYLNKTLNESMTGLTAKVFRTYNASSTLQEQLNKLTDADMSVEEKILSYNRANRAVAILCNHQRAAPKTFEKSMQLLQEKIAQKRKQLDEAKKELKEAKTQHRQCSTDKSRKLVEKKENAVKRLEEQLKKLQLQMTDREENKVIALGTSKLNYLDPRISVAWCKKFGVPIEKIYNKTQRDKFAWAIDMTEDDYQF
ncbi:hypothetical protein AAFF_G00003180 [Aldrovandia affinis]|uniref:DNA topoisomerase I n=1 Tax=Aldrovandia affinis TaxID=143900 RepID=A0AAD7TD79_9TELE|nr:hypothetical protein AAFF_G00003180 [Aldrovandia affinis]